MSLKTYSPIRAAAINDVALRAELQKMDEFLRQISLFAARVPAMPQGTPSALVPPPVTSVDLDNYLYLPGRVGGQIGYGSNLNIGGLDVAFKDWMVLAGNKISQTDATYAPGTIRLGIQGSVDVTSYFAVSPSVALDTFTSQPFFIATNADAINGDYVQLGSTGNASFDKNESVSSFPGYTVRIQNQTTGRPAEDILLISRNTANTNKHINLVDNLGASYGYMQGSDWLTTGRLVVGDGAFASERLLDLSDTNVTTNGTVNQINQQMTLKPTGASVGTYTCYNVVLTDSNTFSSGSSYGVNGITLTMNCAPPTGVTASLFGFNGAVNVANTAGSIASIAAGQWSMTGGSGASPAITSMYGIRILISNRNSVTTTLRALSLENSQAGTSACTDFVGIDYGSTLGSSTGTRTWHAIRHTSGPTSGTTLNISCTANGTTALTSAALFGNVVVGMNLSGPGVPANTTVTVVTDASNITVSNAVTAGAEPQTRTFVSTKWFFDLTSSAANLASRILHRTAIGWSPTGYNSLQGLLHLGAGTTSIAPLCLTSGTSLTTALAGTVEFTTDDLFFTITTGAARKRFLFADATAGLTSGRVPYATTNGRLTDTANFTFNGTDLVIPGNFGPGAKTPAHFIDIPAGTTAVAPIRLTAGTNLTTATAGCFEYDGTSLFFTPGAGRQTVCYTDVAQTISGPLTFTADPILANTNSLRAKDSGGTSRTIITALGTDIVRFAPLLSANGWTWTDTIGNVKLQLTALATTPLFTFNDPFNFVFGTTTGTKLGTATTQKIGFWNTAPIVQPTTAVGGATRVGGGGAAVTDTDTFDGYTIGQVVKALRNLGVLA